MDPKEIVRSGYDRVSYAYRGDEGDASSENYLAWIDELAITLPDRARVLDLGCGNGIPVTRRLAQQYAATGVDLSPVQIDRARALVPEAEFICADMTAIDFPPASFDAVVSFYAIIHVPLEEQPALLGSIHRWLKPGGRLMATVGHTAWTGTEADWLGVEGGEMYWSHTDQDTYQQWLAQAGFTVLWTRFIPEGTGGHTLMMAQKGEG